MLATMMKPLAIIGGFDGVEPQEPYSEVLRSTELRGVSAAARRCGVSHTHLRKVLQGERVPSAELQRRMYRLGLYPGMMRSEVAR